LPLPSLSYLKQYVLRLPTKTTHLPSEAESPLAHFERATSDAFNLLVYFDNLVDSAPAPRHAQALAGHRRRLATMSLLAVIESFERFLKELAAICVDEIGPRILDDRLDKFSASSSAAALHFRDGGSLGRFLCESLTWCDCESANTRFRFLLSSPWQDGKFYVFPKTAQQLPLSLQDRYETVQTLWQVRHCIAHSVGVISRSDARKFQLLTRSRIDGQRLLDPARKDVWYAKMYLENTAKEINREVKDRVCELLTGLHVANPTLLQPTETSQRLDAIFALPCTIAGVASR
jgi:hypothetical protein